MAKVKRYDAMVRVEYTWENEFGTEHTTWVTHMGVYFSDSPDSLPEYIAAHHMKFTPPNGEKVKRMLFSEITQHTLTEVK